MERSKSAAESPAWKRRVVSSGNWKVAKDSSPVKCPYFYDKEGNIQKSENSESLLRVKYALLPSSNPKPMLPGVVPIPRPFHRSQSTIKVEHQRQESRGRKSRVGDYGLKHEVFVMENGVEVDEYQRFPGFRFLILGSDALETAKFWKACRSHLTRQKYRYIYLANGTKIHGLKHIPEDTKVIIVSAVDHFLGIRFRSECGPYPTMPVSTSTPYSPLKRVPRRTKTTHSVITVSPSPVRSAYKVEDLLLAQKK